MSEQHESIHDLYGEYSVDDEDQLQPEDTLDDPEIGDVLDRGYSPADSARGSRAYGTTAAEQHGHETIDQRILQEVPDPTSAYGAPFDESGLDTPRVGGEDPDSIHPDDDWLGDREVGAARSGRLVAPDLGYLTDTEPHLVGSDVGIDGAGASAEEAAMHVIDEDDGWE